MKNIFSIIFSALLMFSIQSVAQEKNNKGSNGQHQQQPRFDKDDYISKRNAFIAEKVGLTAEKAAVFLPMENELLNKKFELDRECRKIERELRDKKVKLEAECNKLLKCKEEVKEKFNILDKEYLEKFKKILTSEEILKYQKADKEFYEEYFSDRKR